MAGSADGLYEVEQFLDKLVTEEGQVLYFVRWKGFPPSYDTWEPLENLGSCLPLLKKFEKARKNLVLTQTHAKKLVSKSKMAKKGGVKNLTVKGTSKVKLAEILMKNAERLANKKLGKKSKCKSVEKIRKSKSDLGTVDNSESGSVKRTKKSKGKGGSSTETSKKPKTVQEKLLNGSSDFTSVTSSSAGKLLKFKTGVGKKSSIAAKAGSSQEKTKVSVSKKSGSGVEQLKKKKTDSKVRTYKKKSCIPSDGESLQVGKKSPSSSGKKSKLKNGLNISISGLIGLTNSSNSPPAKKSKSQKILFGQLKRTAEDDVSIYSDEWTSDESDSDVLYSLADDISLGDGDYCSELADSGRQDGTHSKELSLPAPRQKTVLQPPFRVKKIEMSDKHMTHVITTDGLHLSPVEKYIKSPKKMRLLDSIKKPKVKPVVHPVSPPTSFTTVKAAVTSASDHPAAPTKQPYVSKKHFRGGIPTYEYVVQPSAVTPVSPSSMSYKMLLENLPYQLHPKKTKKRSSEEEEVERRSSVRQTERVFRYKEILIKKCQKYTQIWLNTHTKMKNSLNPQVIEEIVSALSAAKFDDSNLVMLSGFDNIFCSGVDLNFLVTGDKKMAARQMVDALRDLTKSIITFPKPLIAVVTGPAIGLGMTILPLCDVVYASDKATFHMPYAQLAQTPEGCASYTLPQALGMAVANDLLLGGRRITAIEACQLGLISQVFWPTSMMQEVVPRIQSMALQPGKVLETTKLLVRSHQRTKLDLTSDTECNLLLDLWPSTDCQRAIADFLSDEKNYTF